MAERFSFRPPPDQLGGPSKCDSSSRPLSRISEFDGQDLQHKPASVLDADRTDARPHEATLELIGARWSAEVEALDDLTTKIAEQLDLCGRFRAFNDHIEVERIRNADDCADQGERLMIRSERGDEVPINLEDIDGKVSHIGER